MQPDFFEVINLLNRGAGILMPVSALPSKGDIGTLGKEAFKFIDKLKKAGCSYWQVLPVGPTSFGDSPYQSFSAFAGNPYFIDLDRLCSDGLLPKSALPAHTSKRVDYGRLWNERYDLLWRAYQKFGGGDGYDRFCAENACWLDDYALFMAIKGSLNNIPLCNWDDSLRCYGTEAVNRAKADLADKIDFHKFLQFRFSEDWARLREYANGAGIKLIGDMPIYVCADSADVWARPDLFLLDRSRRPEFIAGVPPDAFSDTGQRWGNPLYDWARMEADGFDWWKKRITHLSRMFDAVRIDHFIGIARYWAIPASAKSAVDGEWRPGPGKKLTDAIDSVRGDTDIIAEDLGVPHESVTRLLEQTGYPGMKILCFAFDSGADNPYLPHNHIPNSICYTATHDNDTLAGWLGKCERKKLRRIADYLGCDVGGIGGALIREGYRSVCRVSIFQMQDVLGLGEGARMNMPSTDTDNWQWRLGKNEFTNAHASALKRYAETYNR